MNNKPLKLISMLFFGSFIFQIILILILSNLSDNTLRSLLDIPNNVKGIIFLFHLLLSVFMFAIIGTSLFIIIITIIIFTVFSIKETFPLGLLYFPLCFAFGFGIVFVFTYSAISVLFFEGQFLFNITDIKFIFFCLFILLIIPRIISNIVLNKIKIKNKIIKGMFSLFSFKYKNSIYMASIILTTIFVTFDIIYLKTNFTKSIIVSVLTIIWLTIKYFLVNVLFLDFLDDDLEQSTRRIDSRFESKNKNNTDNNFIDGKDCEDVKKNIWTCSSCSWKNPIYLSCCENCGKLYGK